MDFTLYKQIGDNASEIIGYYDSIADGASAIEDDMAANDEVNVRYKLKQGDDVVFGAYKGETHFK